MRNKGASFSRAFRLLKPVQFQRVFTRPRVCSDAFFKLFARKNEVGYPRLGIAVSRQVDRRAAGRNRIKRVIRESFRQRLGEYRASQRAEIEIGTPAGVDIVVVARRAAAEASNKRLFGSLGSLWARLEATRGAPLAAGGAGPDRSEVKRSALAGTGSSHG